MAFTHLHVHTEYSLLDGSAKIKELVARAKELGMTHLAITDHGVMYGAIDFYKACLDAGITPVIGCEVYVAPEGRFKKEGSVSDERYHHLVLLAETNQGYANLVKIVSKGFTEGYYYKPRVDLEVLETYHEGIIALSACLAGEVASNLKRGLYEEGKRAALRLNSIFGDGNFFLELQDHGISEQKIVNRALLQMHNETGLPLVATNDSHYIFAEDAKAHDILLCIQTQKKVTDENRMRYEGGQFYLKSEEEMRSLFPYAQEALDNTQKIADRCKVTIEFGNYKLPKYDVPEGYTAETYLEKLCNDGLINRYKTPGQDLRDRMEYELGTIKQMGFVDYFLIVWDYINYAKKNGISVGPGRGSAAGSIVSYCLEITDIDPIRYSLLFERFLNPERVTMPDIDVDFCFERRQEVIDYVSRKYGKDKVVQIVTFGTMAARNVIRDVGRAMDISYSRVDQIAKMIPKVIPDTKLVTIKKSIEVNKELADAINTDPEVKELIDMSMKLEGLPRHTSMHAAGVVISNAPVDEYVPLSRGADDAITTQYTMTTLEELGLLKMDFLGLRTLTVIQDAVELINQSKPAGEKPFSISDIDYDDKEVYESLAGGHTEGIFQLESGGMMGFMKELKPENIEDVIAGISLYRPGPMDYIPKYIKWKKNPQEIEYDCPELEPILKPTYGCIVYQEQVMQIVRDLGGYSFGRSDLVRRAMSKKKLKVMEAERQNFVYGNTEENIPGCVAKGISEKAANEIYDKMMDFASYAFNKSHAACYAVVSYQTAYLKHYYPAMFMAALMTSVIDKADKVSQYIDITRRMGISILPPDVNKGHAAFGVDDGSIRYALCAIKGIGGPVIEGIVEEREANGEFTDLQDFCTRLSGKEVNKRTIESFIKAGAFDGMPGSRRQKMMVYERIMDGASKEKKNMASGQLSLFSMDGVDKDQNKLVMPDCEDYTKEEALAFEKEVLGVYLNGHPLDSYAELLSKNEVITTDMFMLDEETGEAKVEDTANVRVGGIIQNIVTKVTKSGQLMGFITLEDTRGTVEVLVFPKDYERNKREMIIDNKVLISGRASVEEDKAAKIIFGDMVPFDKLPRELWVKFKNKQDFFDKEAELYELTGGFDGNSTICIYLEEEKAVKKLGINKNVLICNDLLEKLYSAYGKEKIGVKEVKWQSR